MAEQFYTILTRAGEEKIASSIAKGTKITFKSIALGDSSGVHYNPQRTATALKNEVWRGDVNRVSSSDDNPNWVTIELAVPSNIGGFTIREAGVYDSTGTLVAISKHPATEKPLVTDGSTKDLFIRVVLDIGSEANVDLTINPNIVTATLDNVNDMISLIQDKADKTYVNNQLNNKADKSTMITQLNLKADKIEVNTELNKKANTSYVNTELNKKSNLSLLDNKADKSTMITQLNFKADKTYVDNELTKKGNLTIVNSKADKTYVDTELGKKETPYGSQTKANKALQDAKAYANTQTGEGMGSHIVNNAPHQYGNKFEWRYNASTQSLDLVTLP